MLGINCAASTNIAIDVHTAGAASLFSVTGYGDLNAQNAYVKSVNLINAAIFGWSSNTFTNGAKDVTLTRASAGVLQLNNANAAGNQGQLNLGMLQVLDTTPAASTSQIYCNTQPYMAGTAVTNWPVLYLDSGSTEPSSWSTGGTILGINAPLGYAGNYIDVHISGGVSLFSVGTNGTMTINANFTAGGGVTANGNITAGNFLTCKTMRAYVLGNNTGVPPLVAGPGAGTAPTVSSTVGGGSVGGQISVTTGTAPTASAVIVTATLAATYANPGFVILTPANAAAAALTGPNQIFAGPSTTNTFTLNSGPTALAAATLYLWNYIVSGS
jgi:hypothetical protein